MATGTARSAQERRPASASYISPITAWRQSLILAVLFLAFNSSQIAAFEIEDMRLTARGKGARLVLDLSAEAPFRAFTLSDPDRAVVDLPLPARADRQPPGPGRRA